MSDWWKEQAGNGQAILHASTAAIVMPEFLVDAVLHEHELSQSHSKGMAILAKEVREGREGLRAAETEADALRELVRERLHVKHIHHRQAKGTISKGSKFECEACAWDARAEALLIAQAEAPATAGEG